MKAEEFDQYIRTQFENETIAPPAELEDAVFASLAVETRRRRGIAAAAIGLAVATLATVFWLNDSAPMKPEAFTSPPTEEVATATLAPAIPAETLVPSAESIVPIASMLSDDSEVTEIKSTPPATSVEAVIPNRKAMEEVASRPLSGAPLQDVKTQPQLQQVDGEKWILPATVEVKD
ncbi:MAG: hypothetical protein CL828_01160 [Crocinitomicaceae bacterium]|nr:hypothetical protein [Crocinitomicaceae bacterium]